MTEIAVYQPQNELSEKMEWSRAIAPSGLLPKQYQGNPANLLFAVEYADALGVERIHAITSIHVIEGKPSASADLIAATVRRAGHRLRVVGDDTYAEAHLIRADDPEFTYTARWDMAKARSANLAGKGVWKNYPGAMLRSRAITEVARMGASDALFGVAYTPEELGAEIDANGTPLRSQPMSSAPAPASGAERMGAILGTPTVSGAGGAPDDAPAVAGSEPATPASESPVDAEIVEESMTDKTRREMFALFAEKGIAEDQQLAGINHRLGAAYESRGDLTEPDAREVIAYLRTLPDIASEEAPRG